MNFELDDDQTMIKATVERFVEDRYAPGSRAAWLAEPNAYSTANWKLLAELGVLAAPFAVEDGGMGGGPVEIMTIMRALGRGMVVEPVVNDVLLAGGILALAGDGRQKSEWLGPLMAGDRHLGVALAEKTGRWSLDRIETRVTRAGLSGQKSFATAPVDGWIVSAMKEDAPALFIVAADAPGVEQRRYRRVDGSWAAEVRFTDVVADPLGCGLVEVASALDLARLGATAEMTGLMDSMFETTLDYVRQRRQFGAAIGSFQAIQHRLADLYGRVELARSQLLRATMAKPADRPAAIAAAKAHVSEAAIKVGEEAIQLHGGMGTTEELNIGSALKRVLALSVMLGDSGHEIRRYNAMVAAPV